jgi:iron complex outermembrane recepter protein
MIGDYYPEAVGGFLFGRGLADNWGARSQLVFKNDDIASGGIGVDWRRLRQFYRETTTNGDGSPGIGGDTFGIPDSSVDDAGIFAHGETLVTERWTIGLGQRLDWVKYQLDETDIVSDGPQFSPDGTYYSGFNEPTRTLSSTYLTNRFQLSESVSVSSGMAYAMRHANLTEAYSDQPYAPLVRFGNSFALGDSNLSPEKNLQFDLGITKKDETSQFGLRLFHSTIRDYIGLAVTNYASFPPIGSVPPGTLGRGSLLITDPASVNPDVTVDTGQFSYIYRNIDRVSLYGFDIFGERQLLPWLEVVGTTNFTEGINHEPVFIDAVPRTTTRLSDREGLPGIYPLNAGLSLRLFQPEQRRWTIEWQSRFVRHQEYLASSLFEIGTPGFAVHNVHGSYQWTPNLKLRSSILNVFDRNYFEHNSLAIIDRTGNVTFVREPGFSWFSSLEYVF